jgi:hypothetical protein
MATIASSPHRRGVGRFDMRRFNMCLILLSKAFLDSAIPIKRKLKAGFRNGIRAMSMSVSV